MIAALPAFEVAGVPTTIDAPDDLAQRTFRSGRYDTRAIPDWPPLP